MLSIYEKVLFFQFTSVCRKETDKVEKARALREASKRVNLSPECLPSICCYTLLNSLHNVTCADIAEDSSLLAVGFNNSSIKVLYFYIYSEAGYLMFHKPVGDAHLSSDISGLVPYSKQAESDEIR